MEGLPGLAHLLADRQVAHAHLAQVQVHVGEHGVEDRLGQGRPARVGLAAQAADQQGDMQADEVEAALDRVGHAEPGEQQRVARRGHGGAVEREAGPFMRAAAEHAEQAHGGNGSGRHSR